jgi:hypothetical protein
MNSIAAREWADAIFKKKERALAEGQQETKKYEANIEATREKTARLRALRLARDEANVNRGAQITSNEK